MHLWSLFCVAYWPSHFQIITNLAVATSYGQATQFTIPCITPGVHMFLSIKPKLSLAIQSANVLVFQTKTFSCNSECKCSCLSNQNFLLQFRVQMFLSFKPKLSLAIQKIMCMRDRDRETDKQSMNWSKISSLHKTIVSCPDMYQQKATVYYLRMISLWMQKSRVDLRTHYNQNKQTNKTKLPCIIKEYNQVPSPRSSPLSLSLSLSLSLPFPHQKKISLLQPSQDKINKQTYTVLG
jgi:hypothetical protein